MSTHDDRGKKSRSIDQHRRFFGLVNALYSHWPEKQKFKPQSSEHLRAWLLVRAKHCTIKTFEMPNAEQANSLAVIVPIIASMMMGSHAWCKPVGNELHVCVPMSIAHDKCGHNLFTQICADVDEIIRAETGLDPETLLRETEKAA